LWSFPDMKRTAQEMYWLTNRSQWPDSHTSDSLSPLRGKGEQKFDRFVNLVATKWN